MKDKGRASQADLPPGRRTRDGNAYPSYSPHHLRREPASETSERRSPSIPRFRDSAEELTNCKNDGCSRVDGSRVDSGSPLAAAPTVEPTRGKRNPRGSAGRASSNGERATPLRHRPSVGTDIAEPVDARGEGPRRVAVAVQGVEGPCGRRPRPSGTHVPVPSVVPEPQALAFACVVGGVVHGRARRVVDSKPRKNTTYATTNASGSARARLDLRDK